MESTGKHNQSTLEKLQDRIREEASSWVKDAYGEGYAKGIEEIERQLKETDRLTRLLPATDEEKEKWRWFGVEYFCEACSKGLDTHAALYMFCPHCGRKITRG